MTAPIGLLAILVILALGLTALTPLILIYLWIKDWSKRRLW